jgi:hypothetical protein
MYSIKLKQPSGGDQPALHQGALKADKAEPDGKRDTRSAQLCLR